ncbi:MAG: hypothetical protein OHK0039_06680 [Bacteroidia bacterium]
MVPLRGGDTLAARTQYLEGQRILDERGDAAQAAARFRAAIEGYAGYPHPVFLARMGLAEVMLQQRKVAAAEDSLRRWYPAMRAHYGPGHWMLGLYFRRTAWACYLEGDFSCALARADTAAALLDTSIATCRIEYAWLVVTQGNASFRQGAYTRAGAAFMRAHDLFARTDLGKDYAGTCNNIAIFHLARGQYDEALRWLQRAQAVYDSVGIDSMGWGNLYQNTGLAYFRKNDMYQALPYFEKAARIRLAAGGRCSRAYLESLMNLSYISLSIDRLDQAAAYCEAARNSFADCPDLPRYEYPNLLRRQGSLQAQRGDTAGALVFLTQALAACPPKNRYTTVKAGIYTQMADLYRHRGRIAEADRAYRLALEAVPPEERQVSTQAAEILGRWSQLHRQQGDFAGALGTIQQALAVLQPGLPPEDVWWRQTRPGVRLDGTLFNILYQRTNLLLAWQDDQPHRSDLLEQALASCLLEMAVLDTMQRAAVVDQSYLEQQAQAAGVYRQGMEIVHLLYAHTGQDRWLAMGFGFSERSKAALLLLSLKADRLGRGRSLLAQEDSLRRELAFYEQLLARRGATTPPDQVTAWQEQQLAVQLALQRWKETLATREPAYYQSVYAFTPPDPAAVRAYLQGDSAAVVAFFQGEDVLYAFWFTADTLLYLRLPAAGLEDQVRELRRLIALAGGERDSLAALSHALYARLLAPGLAALPRMPARLLVIPDGPLGYLPFAALLTAAPPPGAGCDTWPFLVRTCPVALTHSVGWHLLASAAPPPTVRTYHAFAPGFGGAADAALALRGLAEGDGLWDQLPDLPGGHRELAALAGTFDGQAWTGPGVDEGLFKTHAPASGILHLVTHGFIDDTYPMSSFLAFSAPTADGGEDGRLFAWELYGLDLGASLVVLSACNTGVGQFRRGEGLMSLARAFHFAGAPALVATLWPVQDQSTALVMERFYPALRRGMGKDVALAEAQRAYLATCEPLFAHPFYWSGLVIMGDSRPLPPARGRSWQAWVGGALVLLLLMGGWAWRRQRAAPRR